MRFTLFSQRFLQLISFLWLSNYLIACSSPSTPVAKAPEIQETKISEIKNSVLDAQMLVKNAAKSSNEEANKLLIQASHQFLLEDSPNQALWLSNQLLAIEQSIESQYQLNIIAAKASLAFEETALAQTHINACKILAETEKLQHSLTYYQTLFQIETLRKQQVTALNAYLFAFSINSTSSQADINYIWQQISNFSLWQQEQLANLNAPFVKGWVTLTQLANKYGGTEQLSAQLATFRHNFPHHPALKIVDDINALSLIPTPKIQKVAIILPLSGKNITAGIAAQQGILAAYNSNDSVALHFIDSNKFDLATLPEYLLAQQSDFVIGPLLKENVGKYLSLTSLTIPTLLLNIPDNITLLDHQIALSMRPEDEAKQAAAVLSQKKFKHPIVMSHQDSTSQRIAEAFVKKWIELTGESPKVVTFEQGSKMQAVLKETLAVDQSQQRINQLESRIRENIKTELRNRRDVDMIYIVGNPNQTRLLKPYIDVNISPFAELIPVFSSSRSHSMTIDESTANDLNGLTFTEMPWLLYSQQQDQTLANISRQLWPKRSDSLEQIFAMGFDSYNLLEKLPKMKQQQFIRHYGQTGVLKLSQDNILTRTLLWGTYQNNKVSQIDME